MKKLHKNDHILLLASEASQPSRAMRMALYYYIIYNIIIIITGDPILQFLINPRRACAARVTVVAVCVCVCVCLSVRLSVKSHLTSGASVRRENAASYSAGNEGQKICSVFSEIAPLPRSSAPSL